MQMVSPLGAATVASVLCASCIAAQARSLRSVEESQQDVAQTEQDPAVVEENTDSDGVETRTVVLAIIAAALITALVVCGFYKMCRSGSAAERAAKLFKFDKSSRGESDRGVYVRHSDAIAPDHVGKPDTRADVGMGALPTIPSGSTL